MDPKTDNNIQDQPPEDQSALVSDLLEGSWPGTTSEPDTKPKADPDLKDDGTPKEEPKPEDKKPEDEGKKEEPPAKPEGDQVAVKTWEYKGKQYTLDQMVELGIFEDVIQTARQFPNLQTKYQTLLEEQRVKPPDATGTQVVPGQPVQAPKGPTADEILHAYTPEVQRMAEAGYIEPELFEAFPKLATALMFHRDLIYDMRNVVQIMIQREAEREGTSQKTNFLNYLDGLANKIAQSGEHYALLGDAEVRNGFYQYLGTLQIPANQVNEEFVKRQWVAYNSDAMVEAVKQTASERVVQEATKKRNAKGEGGGARPAGVKEPAKTEDNKMIDSFLEGSWPTGG